jgi:hypothetical protein
MYGVHGFVVPFGHLTVFEINRHPVISLTGRSLPACFNEKRIRFLGVEDRQFLPKQDKYWLANTNSCG